MFNSEEDYILDFKAEDKTAHMTVFDIEDIYSNCTTISASEVDKESDGCYSPTPPLYCKIKKARIMIKRLPQSVLDKYKLNNRRETSRPQPPVRTSRRVKGKQVPGQYLSLHVNKPLNEIISKKKRAKENLKKPVSYYMKSNRTEVSNRNSNSLETLKSTDLSGKSTKFARKPVVSKNNSEIYRSLTRNLPAKKEIKFDKTVTPRPSEKYSFSDYRTTEHHQLSKPTFSTISNFANESLTNYIPPNSLTGSQQNLLTQSLSTSEQPLTPNKPVNIPSHQALLTNNNSNQPTIAVSRSKSNVNEQDPFFKSAFSKPTQLQNINSLNDLPILNTPSVNATIVNQTNAIAAPSRIDCPKPKTTSFKMITVQSLPVPQHISSEQEPTIGTYPKLLIINQPLIRTDPLEMENSKPNSPIKLSVDKENNPDSDIEVVESGSELGLSDTEKKSEPEVIKRILYHTKSVQTKFTCNSSICGLVDSDEFNLNCFYCYDIFPLNNWLEFKDHVMRVHHVEEKENAVGSNESNNNLCCANIDHTNCSQESSTKSTANNYNTLNEGNFTPKSATKETIKLPLEPRIVEQRLNKTIIQPDNKKGSIHNSNKLNHHIGSTKTSKMQISTIGHDTIAEIISLDSNNCDVSQKNKTGTNNNKQQSIETNNISPVGADKRLVLPSLPHITIKKVEKTAYRELKNSIKNDSVSYLKEYFTKLPSSLSIHKVIKTLPKPGEKQLLENGRTRPRYFVVKKVIKLPNKETIPNTELSEGKILPKMSQPKEANTKVNEDSGLSLLAEKENSVAKPINIREVSNTPLSKNGMLMKMSEPIKMHTKNKDINNVSLIDKKETSVPKPTNKHKVSHTKKVPEPENIYSKYIEDDGLSLPEKEDAVPKPTNGRGILFGVTNSMVVIEFLLKLKTFPELWRSQLINSTSPNYNDSIRKLCLHLNNRFELKITELEIRQSIQRVRNWYYCMLKNIQDHNENLSNTTPYKHKFPLYFRILSNFLTFDVEQNKSTAPKVNSVTNGVKEFNGRTLYDQKSSNVDVLRGLDGAKSLTTTIDLTDEKKKRKKPWIGRFECDLCHKVYKRIYELKRHKAFHNPPQFECNTCSQMYHFKRWAEKCTHGAKKICKKKVQVQNVQAIQHVNSTDTTKPKRIWPKKIFRFKMICEICGASYRSIGSLNTHKKDKHLNQREKCVVCKFTALSMWRVVQHQKKRHIVEPGLVEEVARKTRPRTDTKTPFSNEAMQEFLWRREMRAKLKPGEIFYGCGKCRIVFHSRKEKVLHNKLEHPIQEYTVVCLLCLPNKLLLSNSNCARRHYTDIHKVPWHEIDDLVKQTKPIFSLLTKEEIESLKASANYKDLLDELLKDKILEPTDKSKFEKDETSKVIHNLSNLESNMIDAEEEENQLDQNVSFDCIVDHDYNNEEVLIDHEYVNSNEHNDSEEQYITNNYNQNCTVNAQNPSELYSHDSYDDEIIQLDYNIERVGNEVYNRDQNEEEYLQSIDDFIEDEFVEESIVVEEYIDEVVDEEQEEYF